MVFSFLFLNKLLYFVYEYKSVVLNWGLIGEVFDLTISILYIPLELLNQASH